jgi:hypothetical protein
MYAIGYESVPSCAVRRLVDGVTEIFNKKLGHKYHSSCIMAAILPRGAASPTGENEVGAILRDPAKYGFRLVAKGRAAN